MNNLIVSKECGLDFLKEYLYKEKVPSVHFMYESDDLFTGISVVDNGIKRKSFKEELDCINWIENNYNSKLQESKHNLPPLREWMTVKDLMDPGLVADETKKHGYKRYRLYRGENINAKLKGCVYDSSHDTLTFSFVTPATMNAHEPGYEPDVVDPMHNFQTVPNPNHVYTMMIQIVDFMMWLKDTRPEGLGKITWKEIKDVLDVAYIKVWCNCLRSNTLIKLLDGRTITIKEMAEEFKSNKDMWVYSTDEHGNFKPGKVSDVNITGVSSEFIRVTLDNGRQIETTRGHLYMMRDGSYKTAAELSVGESLMPLYFKDTNNGYEMVKRNYGSFRYHSVYKEVADSEFNKSLFEEVAAKDIDKCVAIHHIDYNKKNNKPSNLKIMGHNEHYLFHASFIKDRRKKDPEFDKKLREGARRHMISLNNNLTEKLIESRKKFIGTGQKWIKENSELHRQLTKEGLKTFYENNLEIREKRSKALIKFYQTEQGINKKRDLQKRMSDKWKDEEYRNHLKKELSKPKSVNNSIIGSLAAKEKLMNMSQEEKDLRYKNKIITHYKSILDEMIKQNIVLSWENFKNFECKTTGKLSKFFNSFDEMLEYAGYKNYNHKIVNIEYITTEEEPIYDICVDDWHNYYVDAGVVLHNCNSFYWFGKNYRASQFDASIYPTSIPDAKTRSRFGSNDILCKHLGNLMKPQAIRFFLPQMAFSAQKTLRVNGLI